MTTTKVRIGAHYTRHFFESRGSDGSYAALRPYHRLDELKLQRALLARTKRAAAGAEMTVLVVVYLAFVSALILLLTGAI